MVVVIMVVVIVMEASSRLEHFGFARVFAGCGGDGEFCVKGERVGGEGEMKVGRLWLYVPIFTRTTCRPMLPD